MTDTKIPECIPENLRNHPHRGVLPRTLVFATQRGIEGGIADYCDTARNQVEAAALAAYMLGFDVEVSTRRTDGPGDAYVVYITERIAREG